MQILNIKRRIRVISCGGIGDALLLTPSFEAIKSKYSNVKLIVYCSSKGHKQVFKNNPYIDVVTTLSFNTAPFHYFFYKFKPSQFLTSAYGKLSPSKFYKKNAIEIIAEMLNVTKVKNRVQIFLDNEECEKGKNLVSQYMNPIVIHVSSLTSKNKEWPIENWAMLVKSMPEFSFIQIGDIGEPKIPNAIDMLGKTLRESFSIIKYAKSFIGIDSCFSHVSNAFDIPGVVIFGASTPVIWGHENNINLYKDLPCAPCLDTLLSATCPYGRTCMSVSANEVGEMVLKQIRKIND